MDAIISSTHEMKNNRLLNKEELTDNDRLSNIDPSERILLISHCLRNSQMCQANSSAAGLQCVECDPTCQVNRLRKTALKFGYKGVCIAPGGSLALKFIKENNPRGIVAVACHKELEEGVDCVKEIAEENNSAVPPVVIIPLTKDGCVDTEVDVESAIKEISRGCLSED